MKPSAIGWTDFSGGDLNFVTGCTPVSEGCRNCYAKRIYDRFGRDFSKVTCHADKLDRLKRKRFPEYSPKRGAPHKPMCFVCDTGDLFHEAVPMAFIAEALEIMANRSDVIWMVLTKRPERIAGKKWYKAKTHTLGLFRPPPDDLIGVAPPSNIFLGVTAENQRCADERIPLLLKTPAAVRFVSVEPMLGPVVLPDKALVGTGQKGVISWPGSEEYVIWNRANAVDWVICGAESGPNRRPFDVQWAVDLYEQCREAGVPFFGKQDSDMRPGKPLVLGDYGVVQKWPE